MRWPMALSRWLDPIFTRRPEEFCFDGLPPRVRPRLLFAFRQLSDQEKMAQERMGLAARPRLVILDEELAAIVTPDLRDEVEAEEGEPP